MRSLLIDTSAYSEAMRGTPAAVQALQTHDRLLLCPITIGELLAGFHGSANEARSRNQLRRFLAHDRVHSVPITDETAEFYSHLFSGLKRQGTPIPTNDLWIAASAMEHGASLATRDKHFHQLRVILVVPV
ncbi:MAG: type II toxin-antitoxin system VapC family toxin [Candidatus Sumerlaeota bacterium]|nr:type II toxin-antitoxin system VapC family toxin [Candidatus Sumerlaeota bacterium]